MITMRKVKIYERFGGDIDMWARAGGTSADSTISGAEWKRIDELLRSLVVIARGLAAETFAERTELALERECDVAARTRLRALAAKEA